MGDVFVAGSTPTPPTGTQTISHYNSSGVLVDSFTGTDEPNPGVLGEGLCFDPSGNLYLPAQHGNIARYDTSGNLINITWADNFGAQATSCATDDRSDVYQGMVSCNSCSGWLTLYGQVAGDETQSQLLASWNPANDYGGTDWIALGNDGCTMFYTSMSVAVKRFDVCTGTQLSDLATGLPQFCYQLAVRSSGEVMVACESAVLRLSPSGTILQTYQASAYSEGNLESLALDPDGTSFWVGDQTTGDVVKIDIASGHQLMKFNNPDGAYGLAVFAGETAAPPAPPIAATYGEPAAGPDGNGVCGDPRYANVPRVQAACAALVQDPINLATGATTASVVDAQIPGLGEPFRFVRSYTSLDTTTGELGTGWTDTYNASLTLDGGQVTWRSGTGAQTVFTQQGDGSYQAPVWCTATLSAVGSGYEVVTADQMHYSFDSQGRLTAIKDRNGEGVTVAYDAQGRRSSVTDAAGRQVTFSYDANNHLSKVTLPDGRYVGFGYTNDQLTSVTDLRGNTYSYTYDSSGRLQSEVDQNQHQVFYDVYGSDGRISTQQDGDGNVTHYAWDSASQTATVTDARTKVWTYEFSGTDLLAQTDPYGNRVQYFYDAQTGDLTAYRDALGHIETFQYDSRHNMISRTASPPLSYQETWTYNAFNEPLTYKDGRGHETDYGYDSAGNLTSVTKPGNGVTSYTRDPATGLVTAITDPRNKITQLGYDPTTHQLTSITTPLGEKTTFAYDATGRLASSVDPRGNQTGANPVNYTTTYSYDNADHLTKLTSPDPDGSGPQQPLIRQWAYDPAGNLQSTTDPRGYSTLYGYDNANRLTSVSAPDPGSGRPVTQYGYDAVGNLTSRIDANNHTTTYGYDDANRLKSVTTPLQKTWSYGYDANGDRTTQTDPKGGITTYGYDQLGRLSSINYSDSTPAVSFTYDGDNNLTEMQDGSGSETYSYDPLNELTGVTRGSNSFSYVYDPAGDLTQITYPDSTVITRTYDDDERLASVVSGGQTTSYGYDPAGDLTTTTLPSGNGYVETRSYDNAGRLIGLTNKKGTTTLSAFALTLDPDGNPTTSIRNGATSETDTYTYDSLDRLTSVCFQTSCPGQTDPYIRWTYDGVGNRLTETRPSGTTSYSYNAGDQLTQAGSTTYGYDANGNETSAGSTTLSYDMASRLISTTAGSTTTTYSYDGLGKRLQASTGTQSSKKTNFLWEISGSLPQLALERDGSNTLIRRYIYGHYLISMNNGSSFYYHYDPLGSAVNLTSAAGATQWTDSYEPYGAIHSETKNNTKAPANPIKFAGQYLDPTGLYHLNARQYDPSIGRFTSTDPKPTTTTQPYMSSYTYANDQPTVLTDPSGMGAIGNTCGSIWCWSRQTYTGACVSGVVVGGGLALASLGALTGAAAEAAAQGCAGGAAVRVVGGAFGNHAATAADITLNGKDVIDFGPGIVRRLFGR